MKNTKPEVFILESLSFDDEENDRYEGAILSKILKLNNKKPIYYYFRTLKELEELLDKFEDSEYRYLHLSCHGSKNSMSTTLETIHFPELSKMLKPCLDNRRLFVSACNMIDHQLARVIIPDSKCYSIIGPYEPVAFSDAAIFWSSFYHLIFSHNENVMRRNEMEKILKAISNLFGLSINYFRPNNETKQKYSFRQIKPDKEYQSTSHS